MKVIDLTLLDKVSSEAKESPRLRMNYNFHQSLEDKCHRFLNAVEPGTVVSIHRHRNTSETVVCLRGKLRVEYYDEFSRPSGNERPEVERERMCTESFVIEPGGANVAVSIPMGQWHTVHVLETGTCILEMKNGGYEPLKEEDILG